MVRVRIWAASVLVAGLAVAQTATSLPPSVEVALLKKVFLFDQRLDAETVSVLLVHEDDDEGSATELVSSFRSIEVGAEAVLAAEAIARLDDHPVVYLFPGTDDEEIRRLCLEQERLTVSGSPDLAEEGRVAVAVGLSEAGTPEIVVHRERLEGEGHELPPRLLRLARLVGE